MADAETTGDLPISDPAPPRITPRARNIVLVGFMATGKTTLGRLVAQKAGYRFIDMDKEIERQAGKTIPKIFADEGEGGFRDRESRLLGDLGGEDHCVISTGGGVVTRPDNHRLLQELGFVVWLHTKKRIIYERVRRNPHRPLLKTADPYATICAMVEERKPAYRAVADLQVKTTDLSPAEAVTGILESACWFFQQHFSPGSTGQPTPRGDSGQCPPFGAEAQGM